MIFTEDRLDATEALACGLVSKVVPDDQLMDEAWALARRIAINPGYALRTLKPALLRRYAPQQSSSPPPIVDMEDDDRG